MSPEQERQTVELLARTVVLLSDLLSEMRMLTVYVARGEAEWVARRAVHELGDLAERAEPMLAAAERLVVEINSGK